MAAYFGEMRKTMMFEPIDPEWRARTVASFENMAMMQTLGVEVEFLEPGEVVLGFTRDDRFTQQHGFMHAGSLGTVADSACGWAALTLMPPDHAVLTVEYKLNLLRPADGTRFSARARVVKPGRTLTVAEAAVIADGDSDRPIATMSTTLMAVADRGLAG